MRQREWEKDGRAKWEHGTCHVSEGGFGLGSFLSRQRRDEFRHFVLTSADSASARKWSTLIVWRLFALRPR